MGKTYIDTVKYQVYANVEIDGLVEKPDVVGAIFGQTEGLLGDELDLRELQKNGRIGRIEVDLSPRGGKSIGKIKLPSSLDMVETSILAAALETVDRVGPCDAHIIIEKIEDTRTLKRKELVDRAKVLLKTMLVLEIPESKEISEQVRADVKIAEISTYGPEKLPAGPNVASMDSVILVEGRADVINLLKNDITNAVAVGGANVAKSIGDITKEKETTVFLDGDRGGDIILNELMRVGEIDFIARAPRGKEVEELTRKELIKCLRSKVPAEQNSNGTGQSDDSKGYRSNTTPKRYEPDRYSSRRGYGRDSSYGRQDSRDSPRPDSRDSPRTDSPVQAQSADSQSAPASSAAPSSDLGYTGRRNSFQSQAPGRYSRSESSYQPRAIAPRSILPPAESSSSQVPQVVLATQSAPVSSGLTSIPSGLLNSLTELENTLKARFYSDENSTTKEVPVRDMIKTLEGETEVFAIVFDGIITQRLADLAQTKHAKALVGIKLGNVFKKPAGVLLHTKQ